jgi:uncharacterized protein
MRLSIQDEWNRLSRGVKALDLQAASILLIAAFIVILQMKWGDQGFFRSDIAPLLDLDQSGLASWIWWFGMQGVLGFCLPVILLKWGFKFSWREMGLGLGDYSFALKITGLYLPLVVLGTWILSDSAAFQVKYPHHSEAAINWSIFLVYEAFFLLYWIGWEYLWRGFVLFGTARTFGPMAIIIQAMPFAIMHFNKPFAEAFLSIIGGVALGALVWRSRSFWIAVPIHAAQMLILDFWCSLRARSGSTGIGFEALQKAFQALWN